MDDDRSNVLTPEALDLTPHIRLPDDLRAFTQGGFSDVYKTRCEGRGTVAVKVMRDIQVQNPKSKDTLSRRISREVNVWSSLKHKNILPFLGFCFFSAYGDPSLSLVSPWMNHGTATQYLRDHSDADRIDFIYGVARGLKYLHSKGIVHGDLKGANILVSNIGTPYLCDFGLSTFLEDNPNLSVGCGGTTSTGSIKGSIRWASPEVVDGQKSTKHSDIWAFGCTLLELMTLCHPYAVFKRDIQVIGAIMRRRLPWDPTPQMGEPDPTPFPIAFQHYPTLWDFCCLCWSVEPSIRPTAAQAARRLLGVRKKPSTSQRFRSGVNPKDSPGGLVVRPLKIRGPVFGMTLQVEESPAAARKTGLPAIIFRCIERLEAKKSQLKRPFYSNVVLFCLFCFVLFSFRF